MKAFDKAAGDDLNMPQALAVLNTALNSDSLPDLDKIRLVEYAERVLALGLLDEAKAEECLSPELSALFESYLNARRRKDFAASDSLRKELAGKGIKVKDTAQGSTWSRS